jgi:phosphoribosylamine-glycine ligase
MRTAVGPTLIEYNAGFGDREAMNGLPLLKTPLVDVCQAIVDGNLDEVEFEDKASGYKSCFDLSTLKCDEDPVNFSYIRIENLTMATQNKNNESTV